MSERVRPDEAARALAEVRRGQEHVIDLARLPNWYWWVMAALMVGLSATVDAARNRPAVIAVAAVAFSLGVTGATLYVTLRPWRRAQWHDQLLGARGAIAIVGFVGLVVGLTVGVAFSLEAAGVGRPATLGSLVGAVVVASGGPVLTRVLRRIMLENRIGGR
jgi:hypothetical protein